jgi:hypothetical protein
MRLSKVQRSTNVKPQQSAGRYSAFLSKNVGPKRKMYEETPMAKTGLVFRLSALATIDQLGRRQLDWILIIG